MWRKVIPAADCSRCRDCGEPVCPVCDDHYAECECPGPTQDGEMEYMTDSNGVLFARPVPEE